MTLPAVLLEDASDLATGYEPGRGVPSATTTNLGSVSGHEPVSSGAPGDPELALRLAEAAALLEAIAQGRVLLDGVSADLRARLVEAAGDVFCPDVADRRLRTKARQRRDRAEKAARDQSVLAATGIRLAREKPVFMTPNVFAPEVHREHDDIRAGTDYRDGSDDRGH